MKLVLLTSLLLLGLSYVSGQGYANDCGDLAFPDCPDSSLYADPNLCCINDPNTEGCLPCPTDEPTTASPTTSSPTTSEPTTANPTTADPTTADPTTAEPTTGVPTPGPTTSDPICYCSTETPVTTIFSTPSPTTKSYAKKYKGSTSTGISCGECDCDKDYGVVELRFIYQGSTSNNNENVNIEIFDKDDLKICAFTNIAVDEEIICTIEGNQGGSGKTDFDTETYIDIIDYASGSTLYTGDSFHTSCSSDIVGLTIYDDSIISSGWRDGNPNDGNDCDDCQDQCSCETEVPVTTQEEPTTTCYCSTDEPVTTVFSTPSPTTKSYAKKYKGSTSTGLSCGECDCDKDYGVVELRFIYQGTSLNNQRSVNIDIFDKDDLKICAFTNVAVNDEIICTIEGNQGGSGKTDFDTETYIDIIDRSTGSTLYTGDSFHTSCSSDIVGLTIYDDSIISSGWKDGNPTPNDCDDCQEACSCETEVPVTTQELPTTTCFCSTDEPATTVFSTPSPTTKSYAKKYKGSTSSGTSCGECDCDKDYGVVELRFIYQGSALNNQGSVNIDIFDKDDLKICAFTNVAVNNEIICTIEGNQGGSGKTDFDTETYIDIIDSASGNTIYTGDSFHTSCSSDIVGLTIYDDSIISSGWKDGNPTPNDCDDCQEECDCETQEPFTTAATTRYVEPTVPNPEETEAGTTRYVEPTVPNPYETQATSPDTTAATTASVTSPPQTTSSDLCYCKNDLFNTTSTATTSSKSSSKKKSKGGKSNSNSGDSGLGYGDCDCDKDYGMVELRILYTGSVDVTVEWYDKSGDGQICVDSTDITQGTEATCNVNDLLCSGDPCYEKLETNTFAKLVDANGDEVCTTEIHTSCSRDIVGTSGEGDCGSLVVVTGWKDGNPDDDNNCDDGFDLCPCQYEDGSANEQANSIGYIAEQLADNDYAAYIEQQAAQDGNSGNAGSSYKTNLYAFICAFVISKLFL